LNIGKCELCGKEKEYKYKSLIKRFCSYKCSNTYKWDELRAKGETTDITCEVCSKVFSLLNSVLKVREQGDKKVKYCSQKCMGIAALKAKPRNCLTCGKAFLTTRNYYCSKACVAVTRTNKAKGKEDGFWLENGYKILYLGHGSEIESIKEHIHIMQNHLGRKLNDDEVVHHKNEIKTDNRIENLQVMTKSEHSTYHRNKNITDGKNLFGRK
jgi:hypothetical protein